MQILQSFILILTRTKKIAFHKSNSSKALLELLLNTNGKSSGLLFPMTFTKGSPLSAREPRQLKKKSTEFLLFFRSKWKKLLLCFPLCRKNTTHSMKKIQISLITMQILTKSMQSPQNCISSPSKRHDWSKILLNSLPLASLCKKNIPTKSKKALPFLKACALFLFL